MKILDTPRVNRLGTAVAYRSPFGQCLRTHVVPRNTKSPARDYMRAIFGAISQAWSGKLTDDQHDRWNYAASQVMSHPTLGQKGPLSGQQFHQAINSVRGCVGLPPVLDPPAPVVFPPSVVGQLIIENTDEGVRLYLAVSGELTEDVMVFGQEPCSPGRHKRRNVSYLGLLPPPIGGLSEITHLYKAKFGEPRPGRKVFVVSCQEKEGWKGQDRVTSARVPERPKGNQVLSEAVPSQNLHMHKGGTRAAQGKEARAGSPLPWDGNPEAGDGIAAGAASGGSGDGKT
jgi:hypothetical protein